MSVSESISSTTVPLCHSSADNNRIDELFLVSPDHLAPSHEESNEPDESDEQIVLEQALYQVSCYAHLAGMKRNLRNDLMRQYACLIGMDKLPNDMIDKFNDQYDLDILPTSNPTPYQTYLQSLIKTGKWI
jgi:hypothetical protein